MMIKLKEFRSYNEKKLGVDITFENKDGFECVVNVKENGKIIFDKSEGFTLDEMQEVIDTLNDGTLTIKL